MRRDDGYEMESWGETLSAVFVRVLITFAVLIDGAASGLAGCVWGTRDCLPVQDQRLNLHLVSACQVDGGR